MSPMEIAEAGFRLWAEKPHNKGWLKKIDGTPIPNDLTVCMSEAIRAALYAHPLPQQGDREQVRATHRHKKRGTEYVLIGYGRMQAERWEVIPEQPSAPIEKADMREVAIYRSATDPTEIWVRPREEFEDRFETLAAPSGSREGE